MRSRLNYIIETIIKILFKFIGVGWGGQRTVAFEVNCVKSLLKNGDIFVDCGANKGEYSNQILRKFNNPELHIFEPSSKNSALLIKRFASNSRVSINCVGLSDNPSEAILYSNESGSALASLIKRKLDHHQIIFNFQEKVKLITLHDYWNKNINSDYIDFLKIDVEGSEMNVLKGIGDKIFQIKLIQFEFGGCNIDSRTFFQDFWYFFSNHNFKIFRITTFGLVEIVKYKEVYEAFTTTNFLCLNKRFVD